MYLAPQNIPRAISVLTLGNKVILLLSVTKTIVMEGRVDNGYGT